MAEHDVHSGRCAAVADRGPERERGVGEESVPVVDGEGVRGASSAPRPLSPEFNWRHHPFRAANYGPKVCDDLAWDRWHSFYIGSETLRFCQKYGLGR